ncbi:UNVERIFIED_CONTAM: hypothetical protein Scaly_1888600 [Sesamum calycinum]|uniref:Uncharacterized protein n=1 Tax=Sesamum calycinum TaxID=2727403 RepID=A0AAW2NFJ4_9LAMI
MLLQCVGWSGQPVASSGRGSSANLLSSTDCQSEKNRRWPEDIAWDPHGNKLFSVYSADGGDSQISILNLNKEERRRTDPNDNGSSEGFA